MTEKEAIKYFVADGFSLSKTAWDGKQTDVFTKRTYAKWKAIYPKLKNIIAEIIRKLAATGLDKKELTKNLTE